MVNSRASLAALLLATSLPSLLPAGPAASTTQKIDAPAPDDIPFVVRFNPKGPDEAEVSLRATILTARYTFLRCFQEQLLGRKPTEADIGSPAYLRAVAEAVRSSSGRFPFDQLTSLWVSGQSEETFILTLAQPVRQAMANIILENKGATPLPPDKSLRLIPVKSLAMPLGVRDLEGPGLIISQSKTVSLSYARQLVENSFPAAQSDLARFAASFIRPNTQLDPIATAALRIRASQDAAAASTARTESSLSRSNPPVVQQTINPPAVAQEKPAAPAIETARPVIQPPSIPNPQPIPISTREPEPEAVVPRWVLFVALGIPTTFAAILWLERARKGTTHRPKSSRRRTQSDLVVIDDTGNQAWKERARLAEARADRASDALRSGVLAWMKEKFVGTLFRHRTELLAAQQKAQAEMEQLEQRLEQLHAPLQQRIQAYEDRIAELEQKLANKGEENRHLLGARITLARQQLERSRFESN
ncbi:MAG: hypothetical protein QM760_07560 [Nibricoccus sp.]